MDTMWT